MATGGLRRRRARQGPDVIAALVSELDIRSETGGTTIRMVQHPRLAV